MKAKILELLKGMNSDSKKELEALKNLTYEDLDS